MPSYTTNDPKGWCGDPSRGAALGRPTIEGTPEGPITIVRSFLDRGGYDRNGTYFGSGLPLFWYADDDCFVDAMIRAVDIEDAIKIVSEKFPGVEIKQDKPLPMLCYGALGELCPDGAEVDGEEDTDLCEECQCIEYDAEAAEEEDDS